MAPPRIFISHASPDAPFADRLANDLRMAGADAWLDSSHMASGDFVARINTALANRDLVLLVLSPAAIQSSWVSQEFNAAIARTQQGLMRPPIVVMAHPVRVADIPPLWTVYHRYDASNDYIGALHGVSRELGLNTPTPPLNAATVGARPARAAKAPRAPGGRWSPSYFKTAWAAGIALACQVAFAFPLHLAHGPEFILTLVAAVFGVGSCVAAVNQMVRLHRWGWVGLVITGLLIYIVMVAFVGSSNIAYNLSYNLLYARSTQLAWRAVFPLITFAVALFGPTIARSKTP